MDLEGLKQSLVSEAKADNADSAFLRVVSISIKSPHNDVVCEYAQFPSRRLGLRIICPNLEYLDTLLLTANLTLDSKWSSVKREYAVLIIFFVENIDSHSQIRWTAVFISIQHVIYNFKSTTVYTTKPLLSRPSKITIREKRSARNCESLNRQSVSHTPHLTATECARLSTPHLTVTECARFSRFPTPTETFLERYGDFSVN
ncbi:hypothetical protein TNCV_215561 [Trichonephila clavipes]|nr:hypothetical protein TNCV_215561 [Trichonephila clavipes]